MAAVALVGAGLRRERDVQVEGDGGELGEVAGPRDDAYLLDAQSLQGHPLKSREVRTMHVGGKPYLSLITNLQGLLVLPIEHCGTDYRYARATLLSK